MIEKEKEKKAAQKQPKPMNGSVKSMTVTERGMDVVVRLQNPNRRAMHYISDIRAIDYDPVGKRLTVRLSDQGLTLIPGMMSLNPKFRIVDPNSESEFLISLPSTIVKLGPPSASGQATFVEHRIADTSEVAIEIGWSDTPFYEDPRTTKGKELPAARWERGKLRVSHTIPPRKD